MKFHVETIIGDRYEATDSLSNDEVHNWLLNLEKNDILKIETADEFCITDGNVNFCIVFLESGGSTVFL